MPMPMFCPDIPLCTRQLGPDQVLGRPPAPNLHPALVEEFAVPGDPSSRDAVFEATWTDHDSTISRHQTAQRGYQQRQGQHVQPATLQVVPRRVSDTRRGVRPGSVADPLALERPALGLMLDSEEVLRQMQLGKNEVVAAPAPPEAMPASVRMFLPPQPVQSDGDALPYLVGDLFGAQVRALHIGREAEPHLLAARIPRSPWSSLHRNHCCAQAAAALCNGSMDGGSCAGGAPQMQLVGAGPQQPPEIPPLSPDEQMMSMDVDESYDPGYPEKLPQAAAYIAAEAGHKHLGGTSPDAISSPLHDTPPNDVDMSTC